MEFWYGRPGRLHERLLYERTDGRWTTRWLYP
jgi:pyridoxamine 5'-phosphate oxidase